MNLADFDYALPKELIAQFPAKPRDASRLLVLDRQTKDIKHSIFTDITAYFKAGDVLVLNDTKVRPARLAGRLNNKDIEILLLGQKEKNCYQALVRPAKKIKAGDKIIFNHGTISACLLDSEASADFLNNIKTLRFEGTDNLEDILEEIGEMPLPPYIKRPVNKDDFASYQTVYARIPGAVAAPTAGLHFTARILETLKQKGVNIVYITLHVGYGTFKPVRVKDISSHYMHKEYYEISADVAAAINQAKSSGKKVFAVGTTAMRVLETVVSGNSVTPRSGYTDLFIYPPYDFKIAGAMITNFHLPSTTLLMLAAAFAGQELLRTAYNAAIKEQYRFYSYGDAMLIT